MVLWEFWATIIKVGSYRGAALLRLCQWAAYYRNIVDRANRDLPMEEETGVVYDSTLGRKLLLFGVLTLS